MKKVHLYLFAVIIALAACKGSNEQKNSGTGSDSTTAVSSAGTTAPAATKRYLIKSGCVVYKSIMGAVQTLYWDNYGAEEAMITEIDLGIAKSKSTQIRKEGFQYSFDDKQPKGTKTAWYTNDVDYSHIDPEMAERYKLKDLGSETIAGKECKKYSIEMGSTPMTTWIWNNIMIKTVTKMGNSDMIIEATSINDSPVDPKVFEVPANITFTEN
jgi:hypothetical protein